MSHCTKNSAGNASRRWTSRRLFRVLVAITCAGSLTYCQGFAAKPKKAEPKPKPPVESNESEGPPLPSDANMASLRVKSLDTLYELDVSVEQLKKLREAATDTASTQQRSPAKGVDKLVPALQNFQAALLDGKDGSKIDELRNAIADEAGEDGVQIDDGLQITAAAQAKAADVFRELKASQIAAYLAAHADEVGDPLEMMVGAAEQLRQSRVASSSTEAGTDSDPTAGTAKESDAAENAGFVQETSAEVAELVAGVDDSKAKPVAAAVAKWLKENGAAAVEDSPAQRKALEDSARAVVGTVHPMRVLDCWLERQVALMLSNPQLPAAVDAMMKAKQQPEPNSNGE